MEQKFFNDINTKGWIKALEDNKMSTEFWMSFFRNIPQDNSIYNAILDSQDLDEYFLVYIIKQGWMNGENNMNWGVISNQQKLSEDFIRKFKDFLDWEFVCLKQKLSEEFIIEFYDKVDWYHISWRQKLSKEFIENHKDKLYIEQLTENIYK